MKSVPFGNVPIDYHDGHTDRHGWIVAEGDRGTMTVHLIGDVRNRRLTRAQTRHVRVCMDQPKRNMRDMRALSIKQPYAQWIVDGHKTLDVRSWSTKFRGDFLIHASKYDDVKRLPSKWARGAVVAIATLHDVRPMTLDDRVAACVDHLSPERVAESYVLVIRDVRRLHTPLPMGGATYLFEVSPEVEELAMQRVLNYSNTYH